MLYQRRNYFAAAFCLLFSFLTRSLQTSGYSNLVCRCLCRSNPALDKLYTPTLQRKYEYLSKYNLISLLHDANTALNRLNRFCSEVPERRGKIPCSHTTQGRTKIRTQISTCRMIICFRCHRRHRYFRCTPFCMALFRSCKRSSVIRTPGSRSILGTIKLTKWAFKWLAETILMELNFVVGFNRACLASSRYEIV